MQDHKRYLPNGWLIGLAMGNRMLSSLTEQINGLETWLEEIDEEVNDVLDAIVQAYELTPLLSINDMLLGKDQGQLYRITGREFVPSVKQVTYYFTYLYGGGAIFEKNDEEDDD